MYKYGTHKEKLMQDGHNLMNQPLKSLKDLELAAGLAGALTLIDMLEHGKDHAKHDDATEEMDGAEHYIREYHRTGDKNYVAMAKDELKHAEYFIKHMQSNALDMTMRDKVQKYTERWNKIHAELSKM